MVIIKLGLQRIFNNKVWRWISSETLGFVLLCVALRRAAQLLVDTVKLLIKIESCLRLEPLLDIQDYLSGYNIWMEKTTVHVAPSNSGFLQGATLAWHHVALVPACRKCNQKIRRSTKQVAYCHATTQVEYYWGTISPAFNNAWLQYYSTTIVHMRWVGNFMHMNMTNMWTVCSDCQACTNLWPNDSLHNAGDFCTPQNVNRCSVACAKVCTYQVMIFNLLELEQVALAASW